MSAPPALATRDLAHVGESETVAPRLAAGAAALAAHALLIAAAVVFGQRALTPPSHEPPPALVVTLVEPLPPMADAATASPDGGDAASPERAPPPRFTFAYAARLDTMALPEPSGTIALAPRAARAPDDLPLEALPEDVRRLIDGYRRCASAAPAEQGAEPACARAAERLAAPGGGAAGPDPRAFLDESVLFPREPPALVRLASAAVTMALFGADETMFEGRAGDGGAPSPTPTWLAYGRESRHLVDERIFDPRGRDIEAGEPGQP